MQPKYKQLVTQHMCMCSTLAQAAACLPTSMFFLLGLRLFKFWHALTRATALQGSGRTACTCQSIRQSSYSTNNRHT